jgi:hypothetical protein
VVQVKSNNVLSLFIFPVEPESRTFPLGGMIVGAGHSEEAIEASSLFDLNGPLPLMAPGLLNFRALLYFGPGEWRKR